MDAVSRRPPPPMDGYAAFVFIAPRIVDVWVCPEITRPNKSVSPAIGSTPFEFGPSL